jgi:hypothetical protein
VLVLWGTCREGPGVPGWPWVEVLRAYVERVGSERLTQQVGSVAIGLAGLLPELGSGLAATVWVQVIRFMSCDLRVFIVAPGGGPATSWSATGRP